VIILWTKPIIYGFVDPGVKCGSPLLLAFAMSVDLSSTDGDERFKFAPGFLSDSPPDMQHPPLQYDNSLSSLTPSLPSTSDDSSPHKIMSSAPTPHRHVRHSSLNLFRRLPIDVRGSIFTQETPPCA
jgi:hypothetical protein